MAKNVLSLQLLRNSTLFGNYADAVAGITGASTNDGTIKLARYNESGTTKTIFGIYHDMNGGTGYTIYDADKVKVDEIVSRLDALDGGGSSSGTVDQKIADAISALDYTGVTTGDGVVVTNVTETDGVVSATAAEVGGLKLTNYSEGSESGHVAANDTINAALAKLQNQIDAANESKNAAIEALDYTDTATTGYYVSKVDEADGVISVTREALPTVAAISSEGQAITAVSQSLGTVAAQYGDIAAAHVTVADAGDKFTATTVEAALAEVVDKYVAADTALKNEILGDATDSGNTLGKLEDRIEALDADAKEYHIVKTTTGLPETVKERYSLVDAAGNVSGETIDIPKDSHISAITYDGTTQKLTYTYIDAAGATQSTDVDMSELVLENEFGSGVTVTNHVAHGVVDPTSEGFLTVGADGFKLAGVQTAINNAIDGLDSGFTAATGQYITAITEENGLVTASAKQIQASEVAATAIAEGTDTVAVTGTNVADQIASLGKSIDAVKDAATAAHSKVEKDSASATTAHMTLTSSTDANNAVTYTVGLVDVASDAALAAEIAARKAVDGQNGDTYAANSTANYINNAQSLNDADVKLDTALKAVSDRLTAADTSITSDDQAHISGTVAQLDGKITAFTLSENNIANADDLADAQAEIDAIEAAVGLGTDGSYVATSGKNSSGATTVLGALNALDDAVSNLSGQLDGVDVVSGNGITVETGTTDGTVYTVAVNLKEDAGSGDNDWHNPLKFDATDNSLYFDSIDAGTY